MKRYMIFFLGLCLVGCQQALDIYQIKIDGVFAKSTIITQFSVSEFKMDHADLTDIRPKEHTELMRYCCYLKNGAKGDNKVLFNMDNLNYRWSLCKLDTHIVESDSLNKLSFEEKLKYLNETDQYKNDKLVDGVTLPFQIRKGFVYQIFGLPNLEGSFYFLLNSNNKLIVQFVDKGPW